MCCTCFVITSSVSRIFPNALLRRLLDTPLKSTTVCYISVLKLNRLLIICVELAFDRLLVLRIKKRFVMQSLTYTAQVDESVLHISIETQQVIDYMCCTCFASTSSDWHIFFKSFVTPTLTYTAQVVECVTCLF